jgi:hypothetical protein
MVNVNTISVKLSTVLHQYVFILEQKIRIYGHMFRPSWAGRNYDHKHISSTGTLYIQPLSIKFRDWFKISAEVNVGRFREKKCSKGVFADLVSELNGQRFYIYIHRYTRSRTAVM